MYDNLPFVTDDRKTILAFLNSDLLQYQSESIKPDKETGEELRTTYSKYSNLSFTVNYNNAGQPIELRCKGSFHYLMNDGKHNADRKTFTEAKEFLVAFGYKFGVDLKLLKLHPPEFAVNTVIPFDVVKFIQNLFYEQRKQFNNNAVGHPSKISGKPTNDYRLKVYSKYHEHPKHCKPNTLRLEYQAKKMRGLHRAGIKTIADLLILKNWVKIKELHLSYFKHLVVYDYNIQLPKNSKYRKKIADYSNANEWENLVEKIRTGKEYGTKYNEEVTTLNLLSKKYGANLLPKTLQLAEMEWFKFLNVCKIKVGLEVQKPKEAPLYKPKEALFIECTPCMHYVINISSIPESDIHSQNKNKPLGKDSSCTIPQKEDAGVNIMVIDKAFIRKYAVDLFEKNLNSYRGDKFIDPGYFDADQAEKIVKNTVKEVYRKFTEELQFLNLNIWQDKYFICPFGSVVDWDKATLLVAFNSQFYNSKAITTTI